MAGPVAMLRNFAVPAGAVLVLFTQVWELDAEATWPRITLPPSSGFCLILFALSGANAALFGQARVQAVGGSACPASSSTSADSSSSSSGSVLLLSWVWGTNIGGLFAAVGVTSIVIGLAVQTAVGPVIAGLFLLFEQPFRIGDWLDTGSVKRAGCSKSTGDPSTSTPATAFRSCRTPRPRRVVVHEPQPAGRATTS